MPDRDRILSVFPEPADSSKALGFELVSLDMKAWTTRVRFEGKPEFRNPAGYIQGGFQSAMLDDTIGFLSSMKTAPRAFPATVDLHTHFLRPVRVGTIEVLATLRNFGRNIIFAEAQLFDCRGKESARATASLTINPVSKPPVKANT